MHNQSMKKQNKIDMTTGSIVMNVFLFAIPIVLGNILQMMYTTVDALVISKFCGDTALAAIGTSAQPVEVLLCIFLGIGVGISILMSQHAGAKNEEGMRSLCKNAVYFLFVTAIPIAILGYIGAPYMLRIMKVPDDAFPEALAYTRIVFLGALGNIGYNMNAGILRGLGDSKASLFFLFISCIINILLDLLFVAGLKMEISGAALATIIAMYFSWGVSIIYIRKKFKYLEFPVLPQGHEGLVIKSIIAIGLPIGLNHSLYSFGHVVLQSLVNQQGYEFMAGITAAGRVTNIANVAITALSSAATTFSGQNFGAKRYDRLRRGYIKIPIASGLITLAFGLTVISFRMPILRFFSEDELVLMYAERYVITLLLCQWVYAIFNGIICMVNGVGLVRYTTIVNILMLWLIRIPSAYLIAYFYDGTQVMLCYPISFTFGMIMMLGYYVFSKKWKRALTGEITKEEIA